MIFSIRKPSFFFYSYVFIFLLSSVQVFGQDDKAIYFKGTDLPAIQHAQELVDSFMKKKNVPGLEIGISINGQTVWTEGFGYADIENKVPVWPNTKMRIGSVSKSLTSVALGKLMEEGRLDLDKPIQKYVPFFPEKKYTITTRDLANHVSGIRTYRGNEFLNTKHYSIKGSLNIFKDDSLLFKPGEKFLYTSYGWVLLSAVIEGACQCDFLSYMKKNVFGPLKMDQTIGEENKPIIKHRSRYYSLSEDLQIINAPYLDNSYKWAAGAFLSNVNDLLKFGNSLLTTKVLSKKTIHELWKPSITNGKNHYGMGWRNGKDKYGYKWVKHSGYAIGGTSVLIIYPNQGLVMVIINNLTDAKYNGLEFKIANLFMKEHNRVSKNNG